MRGDGVRTSWFFAANRRLSTCRGCGAAMAFYQNVRTGNWMPFTGEPRALRTGTHEGPAPGQHRQTVELDLAGSHFDCPAAKRFSRKGRR